MSPTTGMMPGSVCLERPLPKPPEVPTDGPAHLVGADGGGPDLRTCLAASSWTALSASVHLYVVDPPGPLEWHRCVRGSAAAAAANRRCVAASSRGADGGGP